MEAYDALIATIALTMGVSWASGINLYIALLVLGLGGAGGHIQLPPDLLILQEPVVIAAAGFMYCVEFFADKTPGVDTSWDVLHSFIRVPAGAVLAAGAVGDVTPALTIAAGIVGGGVAATAHVTKTATRMAINTSPEPVSNWTASFLEDIAVLAGLWTALNHPVLFLVLLVIFFLFVIWLLPRLWRFLAAVFARLRQLFRSDRQPNGFRPFVMGDLFRSGSVQGTPQLEDRFSRLRKLKDLLDAGAISEEEYQREKRRLIDEE